MTIRVLLVEDSPVAQTILKRILSSSPEIEVVGTAHSGVEALAILPDVHPDVICTDYFMPHMDGLELTSKVMMTHPLPILVVSASVQENDRQRIFQLLEAGAVDVFPKPESEFNTENTAFSRMLIEKIRVLSGVKVFKKRRSARSRQPFDQGPPIAPISTLLSDRPFNPKILAIGASTGGPIALQEILMQLPGNFPLPIVCIQHISLGFLQGLIDWLAADCRLSIQIAQSGERPQPGYVYFPPERQHLVLDSWGRFEHSDAPPIDGHRPSVTTTFQSIAEVYRRKTMGILLTGMGRDGAAGMKTIADVGGLTIAQDEATSVVFGMPKEAIALQAAHHVLPIQKIAPAVLSLLQNQNLNSVG